MHWFLLVNALVLNTYIHSYCLRRFLRSYEKWSVVLWWKYHQYPNVFTLCRTGFVSGIDDLSVCVSSSVYTCVWRRRSRWPAAVTAAYRTWRCWGWWRCESQMTRMDASASSSTTTTTKDYSCRYPFYIYSKHCLQTLSFHPQIYLKKPTWKLATIFFKKQNNTQLL